MKLRRPLLLGVGTLAATALLAASVLPASAAETVATFTLTGGSLTVSAATTAPLTGGLAGVTSVSGNLGAVTVTDNRGSTAEWTATAMSGAFVDGAGSASSGVSYSSNAVTPGGPGTVSPTGLSGVDILTTTAATVVTTLDVSGNNTATWNPTLTVTLPAGALAGDYAGTVTTSVA